jgi:hypothetical protein
VRLTLLGGGLEASGRGRVSTLGIVGVRANANPPQLDRSGLLLNKWKVQPAQLPRSLRPVRTRTPVAWRPASEPAHQSDVTHPVAHVMGSALPRLNEIWRRSIWRSTARIYIISTPVDAPPLQDDDCPEHGPRWQRGPARRMEPTHTTSPPQHLNHMTGAQQQASATTSSSILSVPHSSPTRYACSW